MYLTLVEVNVNIESAKTIANPYELHQILWNGFQDGDRDFLYRIEHHNSAKLWKLYMLSEKEPDINAIATNAKLKIANAMTKHFNPVIKNGMCLKFYLRANPTVKTKSKRNIEKKTRYPLIKDEDLDNWIHRKANQNGFIIKGYQLRNKQRYFSYKGKSKQSMIHDGIDFDGILEVTDCEMFMRCLKKGIGSAKAFGFGLLTVMPT